MGGSGEIVDRTQLPHRVVGSGLAVLLGNALVADQHHLPGDLGQRLTAPVEQVQIHRSAVVVDRLRRQAVASLEENLECLLQCQLLPPFHLIRVPAHRHLAEGCECQFPGHIWAEHVGAADAGPTRPAVDLAFGDVDFRLGADAQTKAAQLCIAKYFLARFGMWDRRNGALGKT